MTVFVVFGIFAWIVGKQEKAAHEAPPAVVPMNGVGRHPAVVSAALSSIEGSASSDTESKANHFKTRRSVVQRIILTYVMTLSSVGDLKARGPALFRDTVGWADAVAGGGLSMGFYPLKCALGWGFYGRLVGTMVLPLFMVFMLLLYTLLRGRLLKEDRVLNSGFLVGCAVKLTFFMFSSTTKNLLLGECFLRFHIQAQA
jgi:hypothetical protein